MGAGLELTWLKVIFIVTSLVEATGQVRIIVADHLRLFTIYHLSFTSRAQLDNPGRQKEKGPIKTAITG